MPDDLLTAAEPAATTTSTTAAVVTGGQPAGVNWESDENPWKKRATGWQGKYQQVDNEAKASKAAAEKAATDLAAAQAALADLTKAHTTVNEQLEAVQTEAEVAKAALERAQLIMTKFPDLLEFETDGLLPDGSGTELEGLLTKFRDKTKAKGQQQAAQALTGATPASPPAAPVTTADDLLKAANAAIAAGKTKEGNELFDQYFKAMAKK